MLEVNEMTAYDNNGELVVIRGNLRFKALKALGRKTALVKVLPADTPKETVNQIVIKDNTHYGEWDSELLSNGWKNGAGHKWYGDRKQTTVINFDRPNRNDIHPTMKPVGLFGYLLNNSTKVGDVVLDSFGGSGTTLIACEELKRKGYLMELDERYCDAIIARWEKLTGKKAIKIKEA